MCESLVTCLTLLCLMMMIFKVIYHRKVSWHRKKLYAWENRLNRNELNEMICLLSAPQSKWNYKIHLKKELLSFFKKSGQIKISNIKLTCVCFSFSVVAGNYGKFRGFLMAFWDNDVELLIKYWLFFIF